MMPAPAPTRPSRPHPRLWVGGLGLGLAATLVTVLVRGAGSGDSPVEPVRDREPPAAEAVERAPVAPLRPSPTRVEESQRLAQELAELRAQNPARHQARLLELLTGTTTERLAAIAHLRDAGLRDPVPLLADAVRDGGSDASVRSAAVELLEPRAAHDPRARAALVAFLETHPEDAAERSLAFRAVLRPGSREEFDRCLPLVLEERDPDVVIAAARAIAASHVPEVRIRAESLHWRHPDVEVRRRRRGTRLGR